MLAVDILRKFYVSEEEETEQQEVSAEETAEKTADNTEHVPEITVVPDAPEETVPVEAVSAVNEPCEPAPESRLPAAAASESRVNVIGCHDPEYSGAMELLACDLSYHINDFAPFLKELIRAYDSESKHFRFDMSGMAPEKRHALSEFAMRMTGFINRFCIDRTTGVIQGYTGTIHAIGRFLKGGWLEIALKVTAEQIVRAVAERKGLAYSVMANAIVSDGQFKNEFDLFIRIGTEEYLIEAKAGKASFVDYEKYNQIGQRYRIIPDHLLLVCSDLKQSSAEIIHDLYHYYVTSAEDFTTALREMIDSEEDAK